MFEVGRGRHQAQSTKPLVKHSKRAIAAHSSVIVNP
jgi:hypothetical protein